MSHYKQIQGTLALDIYLKYVFFYELIYNAK